MLTSFTPNGKIKSWMCRSNMRCGIWSGFEQPLNTSELAIELITREMLIFRCYQVDSKEFKCSGQKHETMFSIVNFLA
jgi:hypothetical protein